MGNPIYSNDLTGRGRVRTSLAAMALSLLAISATSCAATSRPQIPSVEEEAPVDLYIIARFPADWLQRIDFALDEFKKTGQDLSCFTISIGQDEAVGLDFVAILPTVNLTAVGGFGRVDGCGIGLAYYFDNEGKFVRSEVQR